MELLCTTGYEVYTDDTYSICDKSSIILLKGVLFESGREIFLLFIKHFLGKRDKWIFSRKRRKRRKRFRSKTLIFMLIAKNPIIYFRNRISIFRKASGIEENQFTNLKLFKLSYRKFVISSEKISKKTKFQLISRTPKKRCFMRSSEMIYHQENLSTIFNRMFQKL
jgi:hypothetical protein